MSAYGWLDILFNNAGAQSGVRLQDLTMEHIEQNTRLLLSSVMLGTRHAIEPMTEAGGGSIINNASIAGHVADNGDPLYSSLKAAVSHFTRLSGLGLELTGSESTPSRRARWRRPSFGAGPPAPTR